MQSVYENVEADIRSVDNKTSVGGGQVRLELNADHLTTEQSVVIVLSQVFTVAPTTVGNLLDLVEKIELVTDDGTIVSTRGVEMGILNAITEVGSSQRNRLGLNTVIEQGFELHYEMDGTVYDLVTAIKTSQHAKHTLILSMKKDASGIFSDGTISGLPTYDIDVEATRLESLTDASPETGIATLVHQVQTNYEDGTAKGKRSPVDLTAVGSVVRFVVVKCYDETGASSVASDDVISDMHLVVGGKVVRPTTFKKLQARNERKREVALMGSGVAFFDFGDDQSGWLDLGEVRQAKLQVSISDAAPASWSYSITEDFASETKAR